MKSHNLLNAYSQSYQNHAHLLTGKRVWLACSGGRDSMALAFASLQLYLQGVLPFCPQLVHVNHGLQLLNDDWAELVADWANSVGMPCHIVQAHLDGMDEQSARTARYQAISKLMNQDDVLILAHHANDQAETVLMRLFNGAGVAGLSAMAEWSTKHIANPITNKQIQLWRPWLSVSREQITQFAKHHQLPYVDDPTNLAGNNIRSWLRTELMPTIKQTYPQVVNSVIRSASLLADANDILTEVFQQDLENCMLKGIQLAPYDLILDIEQVNKLSMARQSQLIHRWLQGDEPMPPSKHRVDEVLQLIHRKDNDQQAELSWQGSYYQYSVRRYRQQLHRLRSDWLAWLEEDWLSGECLESKSFHLLLSQRQLSYNLNCDTPTQPPPKGEGKTALADNPSSNIRRLRKIDKFAPNPKQKPQAGKKLMQLLAIPLWERKAVYVLESEKEIVAVVTPRQIFR